jgi:hypothetical protein
MRFKDFDISWSSLEPYTTTKAWALSAEDGQNVVSVQFMDETGNLSEVYSDTIILDRIAPTDSGLIATGGDNQVVLAWLESSDATSGIANYKLEYSTAGRSHAITIYSGLDTSYTHTGLTNGTVYSYRVYAVDNAGNVSGGATASARTTEKVRRY